MKLLQQILAEAGADTAKAYTVVPGFGAYFKSVKSVAEYSSEKIILNLPQARLTVSGENLTIGKYFEGDLLVLGAIRSTDFE